MSIKRRVAQIALRNTQQYVGTNTNLTQNQVTNQQANTLGQIIGFDMDTLMYEIQFPDSSKTFVTSGQINRIVGVGDCVIVSNGVIIA